MSHLVPLPSKAGELVAGELVALQGWWLSKHFLSLVGSIVSGSAYEIHQSLKYKFTSEIFHKYLEFFDIRKVCIKTR